MSQEENTLKKGTIGNPYSHSEYLQLLYDKQWKGGFVRINPTTIVYVYPDGKASKSSVWNIDGTKFNSGSDFFNSGSGSGSGSGIGSGSGSGSGSETESGSGYNPRDFIASGHKNVILCNGEFTCNVGLKWSDGFYFENTHECTARLESRVEEISVKDVEKNHEIISGITLQASWNSAYSISVSLKIILDPSEKCIQDSACVTIEESDKDLKGY